MSLVTVVWSMIAAACLTLAAVHLPVWWRNREARAKQRDIRARFAALTPRELEVLGHVVRGRLNKQIAGDLGIHERTVKLHRTAITTKLRVQSVAELTRLTDEAGFFKAPTFP